MRASAKVGPAAATLSLAFREHPQGTPDGLPRARRRPRPHHAPRQRQAEERRWRRAVPPLSLRLAGRARGAARAPPPRASAHDGPAAPTLQSDTAPTWADLEARCLATPTGKRLHEEAELRAAGAGPPHTRARLRLFDAADATAVRVTLFRDEAAWCPYCQKVWLLLEEKRIPYRVEPLNLNAYGLKPAWYTSKVDGGKLPVVEIDGEVTAESMVIMHLLDTTFSQHGPQMVPAPGSPEAATADALLQLEKELVRDWFSLVFYPVEGDALVAARDRLLGTYGRVDAALGATPGPWFLGGAAPSVVDLQFITHVERMLASALYWKGLRLRAAGFPHVDAWLEAFEERLAYLATQGDYYSHVMALPSQNGPGYMVDDQRVRDGAALIEGMDGAWELPVDLQAPRNGEPLAQRYREAGEEAARHEAAHALIANHAAVVRGPGGVGLVRFAARGAAAAGAPAFAAELADPNAHPNEEYLPAVDLCLRHTAAALLDGAAAAEGAARRDLRGNGCTGGELVEGWEACVEELAKDDGGAGGAAAAGGGGGEGHEAGRRHRAPPPRVYYYNWDTSEVTYAPPTRGLDACLGYLRDRIGVPRDVGPAAALSLRAHLNWAIALVYAEAEAET